MLCSSDLGVLFNDTTVWREAKTSFVPFWGLLTSSGVTVHPPGGAQARSTLTSFPVTTAVEKSSEIRFVGVWQNQVSWYLLLF